MILCVGPPCPYPDPGISTVAVQASSSICVNGKTEEVEEEEDDDEEGQGSAGPVSVICNGLVVFEARFQQVSWQVRSRAGPLSR